MKTWLVESKYRIKLQAAYKKASDLELEIAKQEILKEIKRRTKNASKHN